MIEFTLYSNPGPVANPIKMRSSMKLFDLLIAMRSPWRYRHDVRVGVYASIMANVIGMPKRQVKYMQIAGLLHDIGLCAINDKILDKPERLSSCEYTTVKSHPDLGMKIVDYMGLPDEIVKAVAQHHETYGGDGYPLGLKGDKISLYGRILYLAEIFDTMTNETPFKKETSLDSTITFLKQMKKKKFDPQLVDIMLDSHEVTNFYKQKDQVPDKNILLSLGLNKHGLPKMEI